ncbi:MAG: glycosyltransferase family 4 protein [Acidobacteria bacterium]|nr:glycosyltransferase family 4 protein [Acidobacteriota bacterium]
MNILSFADTRFPIERANGVQTMHTCHALAARGHALTLLVRPDTTVPARDPFAFYGLPPCAHLTIEPITTSGAAPLRRAQMLWTGVRRALSGSVDVVFTRDLGLASLLARLPASRRPALVYESHGIAPIVAEEMPRLLGKPDQAPSSSKVRRLDRRESLVWRTADAYVTITQALATDLAARYGHRDAVFVVPDGAVASPVSTRDWVPGPLCVGYAGHLYPWKGIDIFLHALAQTPDVRGVIVGGHPGEADLGRIQRLLQNLHLTERVTMTGLLAPHAVAHALDEADVLVLPNTHSAISDRYTSPLKLFEYLTRGKAIVASDLPSLREVLTHEHTALLVPAGDADALAAALGRLQADPQLRHRLGAAARALAPDFTWERRAERLELALTAAVRA